MELFFSPIGEMNARNLPIFAGHFPSSPCLIVHRMKLTFCDLFSSGKGQFQVLLVESPYCLMVS